MNFRKRLNRKIKLIVVIVTEFNEEFKGHDWCNNLSPNRIKLGELGYYQYHQLEQLKQLRNQYSVASS